MVYLMLADGFEEIEAIDTIDILRRSGIDVKTASIKDKNVKGAHEITVIADILVDEVDVENMEMLILPGGIGHELLDKCEKVHDLINSAITKNAYVACICAAPSIIGKKGILKSKKATCFPGFEDYLYCAKIVNKKVVKDSNIITARGPGAAADFGFKLVEVLTSKKDAKNLRKAMQY